MIRISTAACRLAALLTALLAFLPASAAMAAEILIHDDKSQPESLAAAPDGTLIVGSASSPYVYKIKSGSTTPEVFIDASAEGPGTFFFGQLVDNGTVWSCMLTPVAGVTPVQRHSSLIGTDLKTGKRKLRWDLPGANSTCNDFSVGPDKALYISDTGNAKIFRLTPGAQAAELWLDHRNLTGIDGITFLNGVMYINSVFFNNLYRVPMDASGKAGTPVQIWMDAPVKGPDGMRAAGNILLHAENGAGKVDSLTINGDTAHVTVLKDGLKTPTGVEPAGDTIWIAERGAGKAVSIPMPK
jgi:sugar lactone lactonase YvrE